MCIFYNLNQEKGNDISWQFLELFYRRHSQSVTQGFPQSVSNSGCNPKTPCTELFSYRKKREMFPRGDLFLVIFFLDSRWSQVNWSTEDSWILFDNEFHFLCYLGLEKCHMTRTALGGLTVFISLGWTELISSWYLYPNLNYLFPLTLTFRTHTVFF